METIEQIVKKNWYTIKQLELCERDGICNWFWPKGHNLLKLLPNFNSNKIKKLKRDVNLIADIHDIEYYLWWWYKAYIKANYKLAVNMCELLHWTNLFWRIIVFLSLFISTTLFGFKNFSWYNY